MTVSPSAERPASGGVFVVFEGGEGAGKSTQARLLAESLLADGREVVTTREPGGVRAAEAIRAVLLDPKNDCLDSRSEALLFAAARAAHVNELIAPALDRGAVVVCDRFIDSSLAYQGVARGLGIDVVFELSAWATDGLVADLTVVLDVDPTIGLARAGRVASPDRMEGQPAQFHNDVRMAFLDLAAREPDRYLVLDAGLPLDVLAKLIATAVDRVINTDGTTP